MPRAILVIDAKTFVSVEPQGPSQDVVGDVVAHRGTTLEARIVISLTFADIIDA